MSTTEKQSMQAHDGLTDEAREVVLRDLAEFVNLIHKSIADGTFQAAVFSMLKDAEENDEDGNALGRVCGYRHGFVEATATLMQDTIERYEAFKLLRDTETGDHAN